MIRFKLLRKALLFTPSVHVQTEKKKTICFHLLFYKASNFEVKHKQEVIVLGNGQNRSFHEIIQMVATELLQKHNV